MNPFQICYANDAHLYAEQYAGTTAVFVAGRANCIYDEWQRVRSRGSEVWRYVNMLEVPNGRVSSVDQEIYMGNEALVPRWPYRDANGEYRHHAYSDDTWFTDIRVGSPFVTYLVDYLAKQIRLRRYDGFFFDCLGARLWAQADWSNWPLGERQEWTAGAVDLIRRIDVMRRAEDPAFNLVGNNHWDSAPEAEKYVDGVVSENHLLTNTAMVRIVGKTSYSPLGHRRVLTISKTAADALAWSKVAGVTHVCCTEENTAAGRGAYTRATKPVVGYTRLGGDNAALAQAVAERDAALQTCAQLESRVTTLTAERDALDAENTDLVAVNGMYADKLDRIRAEAAR